MPCGRNVRRPLRDVTHRAGTPFPVSSTPYPTRRHRTAIGPAGPAGPPKVIEVVDGPEALLVFDADAGSAGQHGKLGAVGRLTGACPACVSPCLCAYRMPWRAPLPVSGWYPTIAPSCIAGVTTACPPEETVATVAAVGLPSSNDRDPTSPTINPLH